MGNLGLNKVLKIRLELFDEMMPRLKEINDLFSPVMPDFNGCRRVVQLVSEKISIREQMLKKQRDLPLHKVDVEVFKLVVYQNEVEDQMAAIEKEQKKFVKICSDLGLLPLKCRRPFCSGIAQKCCDGQKNGNRLHQV